MNRRPNLFIVGAPKCGTTSLYHYLDQHPEVFMSFGKEPGFLMKNEARPRYFVDKTEADYLQLFEGASDEKYLGEATTTYLYEESCPAIIKSYSPKAKIVIAIRNPVNMIYSLHHQRYTEGIENVADFAEALKLEEQRKSGRALPRNFEWPTFYLCYRDMAYFSRGIARYQNTFGKENVRIVVFDDLKKSPEQEFSKLCEFLEIDPHAPIDFEEQNSTYTWRSGLLRKIITSNTVMKMGGYVPEAVRAAIRVVAYKKTERSPLPESLRLQLEAEFAEEISRVEEMLDRDFSHWIPSQVRS